MEPLDRIKEGVARDPSVAFALLFGSRAHGNPRADSDWDVGVYFDPSLERSERHVRRLQLIASLEPAVDVDVVVLNDAPPLLAHRALMGVRLLVRDLEAWVRFFVRTLASAGDDRVYGRVHAEARRRRLREGSLGRS